MNKSSLRKIYLKRQKNIAPAERAEKSRLITDNFFAEFNVDKIEFLHCFLPIAKFNEIETRLIFERIWTNFPRIKTLVPRIDFHNSTMESLIFTNETATTANVWKIDEPTHDEKVETEKIDVILIPLLCFDERGFRVGYGKGFYDKFLKNCRRNCLKIGLSYFAPVAQIEDLSEFDVPLNYCITPENVRRFNRKI